MGKNQTLFILIIPQLLMSTTPLFQKYLPESLWHIAENFSIDASVFEKYSNLVKLILESKSLSENDEKQNWFNLLPIMNEEQISKLKDILVREKEKLEEINSKYAQKQNEINQRYQQMFNADAYYKAQAELGAKETKHREQDLVEADNLLAQM